MARPTKTKPADAPPDADDDLPDAGDDDRDAEPEPDGELDDERAEREFALPPGADRALDWGERSHLDDHGQPRIVERELIVPRELAGLRLDHFVKTQIARLSRTKIQDVIAAQMTRGETRAMPLKPATIVAAGDRYVIRRAARREPPCPRTFAVIHEDARLRVIDKPAFLPVHSSAKFYFNTLTRVLAERYPDEPEIQICHRLDRETSGCLVVARDRDAAAFVKDRIADKRVTAKIYLAVVHGAPPWPADTDLALDFALRISTPADPTKLPGVRMICVPSAPPFAGAARPGPAGPLGDPRGLPARTLVRVVRRSDRFALVQCTLVTGRQHQIRAHLAHAGYPIVGDKLYGHGDDAFIAFCDRGLTPELAAALVLPRHALHAASIEFPHPDGGRVRADAPLPADLAQLV